MEHLPALAAWEAFYVIIGTSAAALTGLQFVVIALVAERSRERATSAMAAFATPTVVHFSAVLLLSAILSAPWTGLMAPHLLVAGMGVAGLILAVITIVRAGRQTAYVPVLEDWIWHGVLPVLAYAVFVVAALLFHQMTELALFLCAASAVLLVFIGIHNAWDTATYLVSQGDSAEGSAPPATQSPQPSDL